MKLQAVIMAVIVRDSLNWKWKSHGIVDLCHSNFHYLKFVSLCWSFRNNALVRYFLVVIVGKLFV